MTVAPRHVSALPEQAGAIRTARRRTMPWSVAVTFSGVFFAGRYCSIHGRWGMAIQDPRDERLALAMTSEWARFGRPGVFEVALCWTDDPDPPERRPAGHGWSMGRIELVVAGENLTESVRQGERFEASRLREKGSLRGS